MNLDYSAITQTPFYEEERKILGTPGKKKGWVILVFILVPVLWVPVLVWAISKIPMAIRRQRKRGQAITDFAAANGFTFTGQKGMKIEYKESIVAELPFQANSIYDQYRITGTVKGLPFEYVCTGVLPPAPRRSGDNSAFTVVAFTVTLPVVLPKLFVDSKFNNIPGFNMGTNAFVSMEKHQMEGDFPEFYTVYAEKNMQIEVYSVLTPEVMQALKETAIFDVWIRDNKLVLYALAGEIEYFVAIPQIFKNIELLLGEIDLIARSLRHDTAAVSNSL